MCRFDGWLRREAPAFCVQDGVAPKQVVLNSMRKQAEWASKLLFHGLCISSCPGCLSLEDVLQYIRWNKPSPLQVDSDHDFYYSNRNPDYDSFSSSPTYQPIIHLPICRFSIHLCLPVYPLSIIDLSSINLFIYLPIYHLPPVYHLSAWLYHLSIYLFITDLSTIYLYPPLIPALWRQRQADLCESETSLVYKS